MNVGVPWRRGLELRRRERIVRTFGSGANEGELSIGRAHIVCKDSLAEAAQDLDLGDHILRGKGEISYSPHVRDSVLEDSFEAIIGAIHEDQGYEAARRFVFDQLGDKIEDVA